MVRNTIYTPYVSLYPGPGRVSLGFVLLGRKDGPVPRYVNLPRNLTPSALGRNS